MRGLSTLLRAVVQSRPRVTRLIHRRPRVTRVFDLIKRHIPRVTHVFAQLKRRHPRVTRSFVYSHDFSFALHCSMRVFLDDGRRRLAVRGAFETVSDEWRRRRDVTVG